LLDRSDRLIAGGACLSWLAYVAFVLASFFAVGDTALKPIHCVFKSLSGLPCPFCGMTRSLSGWLAGDVQSGIFFHPLAPLVFGLFTYSVWEVNRQVWSGKSPRLGPKATLAWLAAVLAGWTFKFLLPQQYW
jgi:hypothetical protein